MDLVQVLTDLGLQETEGRFYLAALELGQAPVREIASKADISRTNAYDVHARLLEQGLVTQVPSAQGKTMLVSAQPPEHLLSLCDERRRRLNAIMPELQSLHSGSISKPRVRFYEGVDGIKTVLHESLTKCRSKQLCSILSMSDLFQATGRLWMEDLVQQRVEAGVYLRVIRSPAKDLDNVWPESAKDLRELRFCPAESVFSMTTYIYDEKVAFISSRRENFALTIESAEFAATHRHLFEALWSTSMPAHVYSATHQPSTPLKAAAG
jgi:HTH-type transcriptional regulator, sugar sensing transcriptional regulator